MAMANFWKLLVAVALASLRTHAEVRYAEVTMQMQKCTGLHTPIISCTSRYGAANTTFDQKDRSTGRNCKHVPASINPMFMLTYRIAASRQTEIQVNLYDSGYVVIGTVTGILDTAAMEASLFKTSLVQWHVKGANGLATPGTCTLKFWAGNQIGAAKWGHIAVTESMDFETKNPIAPTRGVKTADVSGLGPMLVGVDPLPQNLQGVWWMTGQGASSALISFGGPNNDGAGCNTGFILGPKNEYKVRLMGDRSISSAHPTASDTAFQEFDAVYVFNFDSDSNPTSATVYSESMGGIAYTGEHTQLLANFTMTYLPFGDPEYPSSKVWMRKIVPVGINVAADYKLVQVIGGDRNRIEPAWAMFEGHMASANTSKTPSWMFYPSRYESPTPGAAAFTAKVLGREQRRKLILYGSGAGIVFLCCICACCANSFCYSDKKKKKKKRGIEIEEGDDDEETDDSFDYEYEGKEDSSPFLYS